MEPGSCGFKSCSDTSSLCDSGGHLGGLPPPLPALLFASGGGSATLRAGIRTGEKGVRGPAGGTDRGCGWRWSGQVSPPPTPGIPEGVLRRGQVGQQILQLPELKTKSETPPSQSPLSPRLLMRQLCPAREGMGRWVSLPRPHCGHHGWVRPSLTCQDGCFSRLPHGAPGAHLSPWLWGPEGCGCGLYFMMPWSKAARCSGRGRRALRAGPGAATGHQEGGGPGPPRSVRSFGQPLPGTPCSLPGHP